MKLQRSSIINLYRAFGSITGSPKTSSYSDNIVIANRNFVPDLLTNVNPRILSQIGKDLHLKDDHPLCILRQRIVNFLHSKYVNRSGNPLFSEYSRLSPIVTVTDNFDSLLVPDDHPSRKLTDSYYINNEYMLRAHMTAHDQNLISSGLDNFILIGDVYRRDTIDSCHYSVFHQADAVRLRTEQELFSNIKDKDLVAIFENSTRTNIKQECHTMEAVKLMEHELKSCIIGLMGNLFGKGFKYRWVDAHFPFTHPSWELEIEFNNKWLEIVGCGILEQKILYNAGTGYKIGWAFGLGLERIAMKLYNIPDIRLFWSQDVGFLSQFSMKNINQPITFKPFSKHPPCIYNISFWIPDDFESNNFFELARDVGGSLIEHIKLVDNFKNKKNQRISHCYEIVYRHMDKVLSNTEVNEIHKILEARLQKELKVEIR